MRVPRGWAGTEHCHPRAGWGFCAEAGAAWLRGTFATGGRRPAKPCASHGDPGGRVLSIGCSNYASCRGLRKPVDSQNRGTQDGSREQPQPGRGHPRGLSKEGSGFDGRVIGSVRKSHPVLINTASPKAGAPEAHLPWRQSRTAFTLPGCRSAVVRGCAPPPTPAAGGSESPHRPAARPWAGTSLLCAAVCSPDKQANNGSSTGCCGLRGESSSKAPRSEPGPRPGPWRCRPSPGAHGRDCHWRVPGVSCFCLVACSSYT